MYLILASKSPRRREILTQAGYSIQIDVSNVDENVEQIFPEDKVMAIARKKGEDVFSRYKNNQEAVVLSADTIVVIDNKILGKPKDINEAREMIKLLQGRKHFVYTAVYIKSIQDEDSILEKTEVNVSKMTEDEIEQYINTKEPYDKAGGYAIQGIFSQYIESIIGDYYNVMGLPISKVKQVLSKYNFVNYYTCSQCGNKLSPQDKFCTKCGKKIEQRKLICPSCQTENNLNNKYCIKCGNMLSNNATYIINKNECKICHFINKDDAEYCEVCGTKLSMPTNQYNVKKEDVNDYSNPAFYCGIASCAVGFFCGIIIACIILAIISITFAIITLTKKKDKKCVLGIIFSVLGIVLSLLRFSIIL